MPWHRQGEVLDDYPQTFAEARVLAGLDWDPVAYPVTAERTLTTEELRDRTRQIVLDSVMKPAKTDSPIIARLQARAAPRSGSDMSRLYRPFAIAIRHTAEMRPHPAEMRLRPDTAISFRLLWQHPRQRHARCSAIWFVSCWNW